MVQNFLLRKAASLIRYLKDKSNNEMKDKKCAVIACPPLCFPWGYDEEDEACAAMKIALCKQISLLRSTGITQFEIALDRGAGLYAAELIQNMRETDPVIGYDCYVPYEEQATKWTPELRNRYFAVFPDCGNEVMISPVRTVTCELEALVIAIDSADSVIAVCDEDDDADYNTAIALKYARLAGKIIYRINPNAR